MPVNVAIRNINKKTMTTLDELKNILKKMEEQNNRLERIRSGICSGNSLKLIVCIGKKTVGKFDLRKYNKNDYMR